jgi:hypothetical protein
MANSGRFGGRRVLSVVGLMVGMSFGLAIVPQAAAMAAQVQARRQFLTIDLPGATATSVLAVNDAGILTGTYNDASGVIHGFVEAGSEVVSFDPPGATETFPSGINDQGTISGTYADAGGALHGFIRSPTGTFTVVNDPLASTGKGLGTQIETINDHGDFVGYYTDSQGVWQPYVHRAGRFVPVIVPAAGSSSNTFLQGINNAGVMVGYYVGSDNVGHGFVDSSGNITVFNANRSVGCTCALSISNSGVIVGTIFGDHGVAHGFTLQAYRFSALNDPAAGSQEDQGTTAYGIDEQGDVAVGSYVDSAGVTHGFLVHLG